jgi:hypothetical protein
MPRKRPPTRGCNSEKPSIDVHVHSNITTTTIAPSYQRKTTRSTAAAAAGVPGPPSSSKPLSSSTSTSTSTSTLKHKRIVKSSANTTTTTITTTSTTVDDNKNDADDSHSHSQHVTELMAVDQRDGIVWKVKVVMDDEIFEWQQDSTSSLAEKKLPVAGKKKKTAIATTANNISSSIVTARKTRSTKVLLEQKPQPQKPQIIPSSSQQTSSSSLSLLAEDGNFYFCAVCKAPGDVVCCDGCPQVFHQDCVEEGPTRDALLANIEPWYCPQCCSSNNMDIQPQHQQKKKQLPQENDEPVQQQQSNDQDQSEHVTRSSKRKRSMEESLDKGTEDVKNEDVDSTEDEEDDAESVMTDHHLSTMDAVRTNTTATSDGATKPPPTKKKKNVPHGNTSLTSTAKKSKSLSLPATTTSSSSLSFPTTKKRDKKKKKKKKNKRDRSGSLSSSSSTVAIAAVTAVTSPVAGSTETVLKTTTMDTMGSPTSLIDDTNNNDQHHPEDDPFRGLFSSVTTGIIQATPAFYFFLAENRAKIEKSLIRKHRTFNRLPKGMERNELIAKEGAHWWIQLPPPEVNRFIHASMKDFEQRVIEWKEEKNIKNMMSGDTTATSTATAADENRDGDVKEDHVDNSHDADNSLERDDEVLTFKNHQRLYLGTTVGAKPFKPDLEESNNRVLLELLHDMRFHPLPMMQAHRPEKEYGEMDFEKVSIPFFDVHGPVATSLGDECLGCTRGFAHFCNVLKRTIPAVLNRARLQPPLSSLMATRVGLGLKPNTPPAAKQETAEESKKVEVFSVRDMPVISSAKALPNIPFEPLTSPTERGDGM